MTAGSADTGPTGDAVDIEILNAVHDTAIPRQADGSGHGLVGVRERALMYGGSFTAGRSEDGGFAVRVRLPAGAG